MFAAGVGDNYVGGRAGNLQGRNDPWVNPIFGRFDDRGTFGGSGGVWGLNPQSYFHSLFLRVHKKTFNKSDALACHCQQCIGFLFI